MNVKFLTKAIQYVELRKEYDCTCVREIYSALSEAVNVG